MAKRIGKFRGISKRESALSLVDGGSIAGDLTVAGASTFSDKITASGGILNTNVTVSSVTSAGIDLTSTASDLKLITTGTLGSAIKLPLATTSNAGMVIEIMCAAATATDGFRSEDEVVQAMSDPRYDTDPAYRQDIYDKLERSNVKF